ncbi:MAG: 50S ribosomal protein L11 methyltransferase [bacterium]
MPKIINGKPCYSQFEIFPIKGYFSKFGAHQTMLEDKIRMTAYKNALRKAIIPGKSIIVEIGTGTGILSLLAARYGARKIYTFELGPIANLAKKIISDNHFENTIEVITKPFEEVSLPEKADIIVSETLGLIGIEENTVNIFYNVKQKFGKKDTILIPYELEIYCCPSSSKTVIPMKKFWENSIESFNFSTIKNLTSNNIYSRLLINKASLLSQKSICNDYILGKNKELTNTSNHRFIINKNGNIEGFTIWFNAKLYKDIAINTQPGSKTHWQQSFILCEKPVRLRKKDCINLSLSFSKIDDETVVEWKYEIIRSKQLLLEGFGSNRDIINYSKGKF